MISNIEPLHREQGAYRNWINKRRIIWLHAWRWHMRDKQLINGDNHHRSRKGKRK